MRLHSVCVFVIRYIENGIEIAFGLSSFLCILRKSTKWYEIKIDVTKNTKKIYERERIMLTCSLFEFLFNSTISASHFVFLLQFFHVIFKRKLKCTQLALFFVVVVKWDYKIVRIEAIKWINPTKYASYRPFRRRCLHRMCSISGSFLYIYI